MHWTDIFGKGNGCCPHLYKLTIDCLTFPLVSTNRSIVTEYQNLKKKCKMLGTEGLDVALLCAHVFRRISAMCVICRKEHHSPFISLGAGLRHKCTFMCPQFDF